KSTTKFTITINYDFCPEVRMADIVQQVRVAVTWIWRNADSLGVSRNLFVSGHSAGGHLSAMMMGTDWASYDPNLPTGMLRGAIPVSGLYDLQPLVEIPLNDVLGMDADEAAAISPVKQRLVSNVGQLVVCGEAESDAFNAQSDL
ncbi:MAG TPA: esterase, partial [Pusillimonas sp.]|nr:esterase [Pusillimonas sp.]